MYFSGRRKRLYGLVLNMPMAVVPGRYRSPGKGFPIHEGYQNQGHVPRTDTHMQVTLQWSVCTVLGLDFPTLLRWGNVLVYLMVESGERERGLAYPTHRQPKKLHWLDAVVRH